MDRNKWRVVGQCVQLRVALRKESVDRNLGYTAKMIVSQVSLSARRAWIEIAILGTGFLLARVALRKESVDRNTIIS